MDFFSILLERIISPSTGGDSGGANYTSIVYNNDNTITLLDKDGTTHTMVCTYEDENLASVTYDGKEIAIGYEGDKLIVGNTMVDLSYVPYTQPKVIEYTTKATMVSPTINGSTVLTVKESE